MMDKQFSIRPAECDLALWVRGLPRNLSTRPSGNVINEEDKNNAGAREFLNYNEDLMLVEGDKDETTVDDPAMVVKHNDVNRKGIPSAGSVCEIFGADRLGFATRYKKGFRDTLYSRPLRAKLVYTSETTAKKNGIGSSLGGAFQGKDAPDGSWHRKDPFGDTFVNEEKLKNSDDQKTVGPKGTASTGGGIVETDATGVSQPDEPAIADIGYGYGVNRDPQALLIDHEAEVHGLEHSNRRGERSTYQPHDTNSYKHNETHDQNSYSTHQSYSGTRSRNGTQANDGGPYDGHPTGYYPKCRISLSNGFVATDESLASAGGEYKNVFLNDGMKPKKNDSRNYHELDREHNRNFLQPDKDDRRYYRESAQPSRYDERNRYDNRPSGNYPNRSSYDNRTSGNYDGATYEGMYSLGTCNGRYEPRNEGTNDGRYEGRDYRNGKGGDERSSGNYFLIEASQYAKGVDDNDYHNQHPKDSVNINQYSKGAGRGSERYSKATAENHYSKGPAEYPRGNSSPHLGDSRYPTETYSKSKDSYSKDSSYAKDVYSKDGCSKDGYSSERYVSQNVPHYGKDNYYQQSSSDPEGYQPEQRSKGGYHSSDLHSKRGYHSRDGHHSREVYAKDGYLFKDGYAKDGYHSKDDYPRDSHRTDEAEQLPQRPMSCGKSAANAGAGEDYRAIAMASHGYYPPSGTTYAIPQGGSNPYYAINGYAWTELFDVMSSDTCAWSEARRSVLQGEDYLRQGQQHEQAEFRHDRHQISNQPPHVLSQSRQSVMSPSIMEPTTMAPGEGYHAGYQAYRLGEQVAGQRPDHYGYQQRPADGGKNATYAGKDGNGGLGNFHYKEKGCSHPPGLGPENFRKKLREPSKGIDQKGHSIDLEGRLVDQKGGRMDHQKGMDQQKGSLVEQEKGNRPVPEPQIGTAAHQKRQQKGSVENRKTHEKGPVQQNGVADHQKGDEKGRVADQISIGKGNGKADENALLQEIIRPLTEEQRLEKEREERSLLSMIVFKTGEAILHSSDKTRMRECFERMQRMLGSVALQKCLRKTITQGDSICEFVLSNISIQVLTIDTVGGPKAKKTPSGGGSKDSTADSKKSKVDSKAEASNNGKAQASNNSKAEASNNGKVDASSSGEVDTSNAGKNATSTNGKTTTSSGKSNRTGSKNKPQVTHELRLTKHGRVRIANSATGEDIAHDITAASPFLPVLLTESGFDQCCLLQRRDYVVKNTFLRFQSANTEFDKDQFQAKIDAESSRHGFSNDDREGGRDAIANGNRNGDHRDGDQSDHKGGEDGDGEKNDAGEGEDDSNESSRGGGQNDGKGKQTHTPPKAQPRKRPISCPPVADAYKERTKVCYGMLKAQMKTQKKRRKAGNPNLKNPDPNPYLTGTLGLDPVANLGAEKMALYLRPPASADSWERSSGYRVWVCCNMMILATLGLMGAKKRQAGFELPPVWFKNLSKAGQKSITHQGIVAKESHSVIATNESANKLSSKADQQMGIEFQRVDPLRMDLSLFLWRMGLQPRNAFDPKTWQVPLGECVDSPLWQAIDKDFFRAKEARLMDVFARLRWQCGLKKPAERYKLMQYTGRGPAGGPRNAVPNSIGEFSAAQNAMGSGIGLPPSVPSSSRPLRFVKLQNRPIIMSRPNAAAYDIVCARRLQFEVALPNRPRVFPSADIEEEFGWGLHSPSPFGKDRQKYNKPGSNRAVPSSAGSTESGNNSTGSSEASSSKSGGGNVSTKSNTPCDSSNTKCTTSGRGGCASGATISGDSTSEGTTPVTLKRTIEYPDDIAVIKIGEGVDAWIEFLREYWIKVFEDTSGVRNPLNYGCYFGALQAFQRLKERKEKHNGINPADPYCPDERNLEILLADLCCPPLFCYKGEVVVFSKLSCFKVGQIV